MEKGIMMFTDFGVNKEVWQSSCDFREEGSLKVETCAEAGKKKETVYSILETSVRH